MRDEIFLQSKLKKPAEKKRIKRIKKEDLTIFSALDQIVEVSLCSNLELSVLNKIKTTINFITEKLEITPIQAVFLSVITNNAPKSTDISDLSDFFSCSNLHVMSYLGELDALVEKRYIRKLEDSRDQYYSLPKEVLDAFKNNKKYESEEYENLSTERIFEFADEMFAEVNRSNMGWMVFISELRGMIAKNKELEFSKNVRAYEFSDESLAVLMLFCLSYVFFNRNEISLSDLSFFPRRVYTKHSRTLRNGSHTLQKLNLVEFVNNDGLVGDIIFKLTDLAKKEFLSEVSVRLSEKDNNLKAPSSITEKALFYNREDEGQVFQLQDLLSEERFPEIQERLEEKGLRTGFACLFYGAPGTGKTETVLQLARKTGRKIMQVNISEVKSKWVGESEKNIKEIFDRYKSYVEKNKEIPILFFNEADAIFGTRIEKTHHSVDKMENTIQNIILQEMENFKGILIATTNLSGNLDSAFERRFLYKIKFTNPNVETKKSIWKSMLPELSENEALELASGYDFSGGQIENIVRKTTVEQILTGNSVSFAKIKEFSDCEKIHKKERRVVGF